MFFKSFTITFLLSFASLALAQPQKILCPPGIQFAICYRIFVPLDHANPQTTIKIPIQYGVVLPTAPTTLTTALLYIPGGPGQSGMNSAFLNISIANFYRRPVVVFDPRGTGPLSRLSCVNPVQSNFSQVQFLNYIKGCLLQAGPEIIYYSTNQVVEDLEVIRRAVGLQQYDLIGVSYGTVTSQFYSRKYPSRIRYMLLDSPLPFAQDIYGRRRPAALRRIFSTRNRGNLLFNLDSVISNTATVLSRLRSSSTLQIQTGFTPRRIASLYSTASNTYISAIAAAAIDNNYLPLIQLSNARSSQVNQVTLLSVFCNDLVNLVPWKPSDGNDARLSLLLADADSRIPLNQYFPFTQFEGLENVFFCTAFPFVQARKEGLPVSLPPRIIPTLVLYGELDEVTPLEERPLLHTFIQSKVAVVRGATHAISFQNNACAGSLIRNFLISGRVINFNACA